MKRLAKWLSYIFLGLVIGLVAAAGLTRFMTSLLFGIQPADPLTLAGVVVGLLSTSILSCLLPGWRASRVEPMSVMR